MSYWTHTSATVKTAPTAALADEREIRNYCRVDLPGERDKLLALYDAALRTAERETGLSFLTQTRLATFPAFADTLRLPGGPVQSVESVQYRDEDGDLQTLGSEYWHDHLSAFPPRIERNRNYSWPSTQTRSDAVTVEYVAGFGDAAADVPQTLRIGVLALAFAFYDNPAATAESVMQENRAISRLLNIESTLGV